MRSVHTARCLVAVVVLTVPMTPHAAAQLLEPETREHVLTDGTRLEVHTGFVRVAESRDVSSSSTIDLAVVRIRRAGTQSRGAHVVLAGGPGDSGVQLVNGLIRQGGTELWSLFDGDVVGIDQRGTGASRPNLDSPALYGLPLDRPGSIEEWLPLIARTSRKVAERFRSQGVRLEAFNTRESADDVKDVCQALGYDSVTLWGRSYGSHLALAVAARHPRRVARMILVSPEGPDHTWKLPAEVDAVIRRLAERGASGLERDLRRVLARLTESPVTVRVKHPLTAADVDVTLGPFDVQWITATVLGDPRMLAALPDAFRRMAAGDFAAFAQIAAVRRARAGVQSAMKHMMDLSSGASVTRRERIARESGDALLGNAINFPGMYLADAWGPVVDLSSGPAAPGAGSARVGRALAPSAPALILVGDLDARTPVWNAHEIAATLPGATVVVLENAAHQFDLFGSPALRSLLAQFLRGERVEPRTVTLPPLVFRQ